jgi:hypothetical protein
MPRDGDRLPGARLGRRLLVYESPAGAAVTSILVAALVYYLLLAVGILLLFRGVSR